MKTFRYNGITYTLYRAGECATYPNYPCIMDETGARPVGDQRAIIRKLLSANHIAFQPYENTYQLIERACLLSEGAIVDIYDPSEEEETRRFKCLLEWFVKQLKINGDVLPGEKVSGQGYKGNKICTYYAQWREYNGFTLDVSMQVGIGIGKSSNYIHVTDARVNVIADYLKSDGKCDVTALKIRIDAGLPTEQTYPAVSVGALGLFDGEEPNETLKSFFRDYRKEIFLKKNNAPEQANENEEKPMNYPLNQILYGPPGTGKTYHSVCYAVAIATDRSIEEVARQMEEDREAVLGKYRLLVKQGRIAFTTFHQSMGYEEFIEGIKPEVDEANGVKYVLKPGIFKSFCERAKILRSHLTDEQYFFSGSPTVWKVSLAGTGKNPVRQECMDKGHIRIGWDEYGESITDDTDYSFGGKYILDAFINGMRKGDVILSCFSANTIDAIGVVTGDYEWHDEYAHYKRLRRVQWLVKDLHEDIVELNGGKQMTLSTVYKLNIAIEDIVDILNSHGGGESEAHYEYPEKYVFIIDEINRGNISKIFGELITLIEESKRLGNAEEMKCILPYSGEVFGVPKNVYLLGTMNTADRSLVQLDAALRRRFSFVEMMPEADRIPVQFVGGVDVKKMFSVINKRITALVDREHQIGHAYFMTLNENSTIEDLAAIFREKVLPLLQEYFYDDYTAIRDVLSGEFVGDEAVPLHNDSKTIYFLKVPHTAEAYRSIYE